jgi:hypothetical protein
VSGVSAHTLLGVAVVGTATTATAVADESQTVIYV